MWRRQTGPRGHPGRATWALSRHAWIAALLFATWLGAVLLVSQSRASGPFGQPVGDYVRQFANTADRDNYLVGAYLYLWYGPGRRHWEQGYARMPALGEYDSSQSQTISQQIDWAAGHGIDFFAVSWWGPATHEDRILRNAVLPNPLAENIRFTILYETLGRLQLADGKANLSEPRNLDTLRSDFRHLQNSYWANDRYLKVAGRPVVIVYHVEALSGDVAGAIADLRARARQNGYDPYIIGDAAGWNGPDETGRSSWAAFDAVTPYAMYTATFRDARRFARQLADEYRDWARAANGAGVGFVPSVLPGFDDRVANPQAGRPPLPRSVDLFCRQLDVALAQIDPSLRMLLVTSWNEWHEDTAVEPAQDTGFVYLDALQTRLLERSDAPTAGRARGSPASRARGTEVPCR